MKTTLCKRLIAALAVFALCAGMLAGCGGGEARDTETAPAVPTDQVTAAPEPDEPAITFIDRIRLANAAVEDDLPEYDGNGQTFIIGGMGSYNSKYIDDEGINGEPINDARYNQILDVESRLGLNIELQTYPDPDYSISLQAFRQLVFANDSSAMHLFQTWNTSAAELVADGCFYELSELNNLDITKPWYFKEEIAEYGYKGNYWLATGFILPDTVIGSMSCVFFNKDLASDKGLDNFYSVVRDGKWTIDYFYNAMSSAYQDLDGDGKYSEGDVYGAYFPIYSPSQWILTCLELPQMYLENGEPKVTVFEKTEQAEIIWNKLRKIYRDPSQIQKNWDDSGTIDPNPWRNGRALFSIGTLAGTSSFRDSDYHIGVLPVFKADESQQEYHASYLPSPFAIPVFVQDAEQSALVMSAMAVEGYKDAVPVVYEQVIKHKNADDYESGEMIDLMLNSVRGDTMFSYGNSRYIYNLMWFCVNERAEFASYWAEKRDEVLSDMDGLIAKYKDLLP